MNTELRKPSQAGHNETKTTPGPEKKIFKGADVLSLFEEKDGRRLVDVLQTGHAILDPNNQTTRINQSLRDMLGEPEVFERNEFNSLVSTEENDPHIQELLEGKRDVHVSRLHVPGQGKYFKVILTAPVINEQGKRILHAEVTDITVEAEEAIVKETELVNIAQKASTIGHDIRNDLTPALGWISMAQKSGKPETVAKALDMAEKGIIRVKDEELPVLSDIRKEPEIEELDMKYILREVVKGYDGQLRDGKIKVVGQFGENLPLIKADRFWTKEIFGNLVGNSLKHGFKKDPKRPITDPVITFQCEVVKEHGQDHMIITVRENGHGIPPEIRDKIFNEGFTTHEEGTGLGLHIVTKRAGQNGWTVNFTSLTQEEIDEGLANPETHLSFVGLKRETAFKVTIPMEKKK